MCLLCAGHGIHLGRTGLPGVSQLDMDMCGLLQTWALSLSSSCTHASGGAVGASTPGSRSSNHAKGLICVYVCVCVFKSSLLDRFFCIVHIFLNPFR